MKPQVLWSLQGYSPLSVAKKARELVGSRVCSGRVFKEISSESSLVLKHSVYAIYFFCSKSCARESLESWHMCGQLFRPCRDGHQLLAAGHCRARGVCQHPKSPDSEIETSCFLYVLGLEMM